MTSALVSVMPGPGAPALIDDLESVGIHVVGAVERKNLVHEVIRLAPDVVVCWDRCPDDGLFQAFAGLAATAPLPVVVFTDDHAAEKIERSAASGIHAYIVHGYGLHRLRSTIHLARARFRHEQLLREELSEVTHRFEERKLVDRAKGILMRARQISEDEAFRILRTTSMHSQQRVGQVSQQVIDAARDAEAVNRAGQLRMLSQRLVKLHALKALGAGPEETEGLFADSLERIDKNLAILSRTLSKATYGDLLDAVLRAWSPLKAAVAEAAEPVRLAEIDALAERLLQHADQLTTYLEAIGSTRSLQVINASGRQRMLSQRLAKQALLAGVPGAAIRAGEMDATRIAFDETMQYLNAIPLSTREIRELLEAADAAWVHLTGAVTTACGREGRMALADASETLLTLFDRLTDQYERSMQMLIG